jgi:hypothetical protein
MIVPVMLVVSAQLVSSVSCQLLPTARSLDHMLCELKFVQRHVGYSYSLDTLLRTHHCHILCWHCYVCRNDALCSL